MNETEERDPLNSGINFPSSVTEVFIKEEPNTSFFIEESVTGSADSSVKATMPSEPEASLSAQIEPNVNFVLETDEVEGQDVNSGIHFLSPVNEVFIKQEPDNTYYFEDSGTGNISPLEAESKPNHDETIKELLNIAIRKCGFTGEHSTRKKRCRKKDDDEDYKVRKRTKPRNGLEKLFFCYYCKYSSTRKSNLNVHILSKHVKHKPFVCSFCEYSATTSSSIRSHFMAVHEKVKGYSCPYCEHATSRHHDLKKHVIAKHTHEKPFNCPDCNHACSQITDLKKHIAAKHLHLKPFTCPHCGYATSRRFELKGHIMSKHTHEKPYACHSCDYAASRGITLRRHILAKHSS